MFNCSILHFWNCSTVQCFNVTNDQCFDLSCVRCLKTFNVSIFKLGCGNRKWRPHYVKKTEKSKIERLKSESQHIAKSIHMLCFQISRLQCSIVQFFNVRFCFELSILRVPNLPCIRAESPVLICNSFSSYQTFNLTSKFKGLTQMC